MLRGHLYILLNATHARNVLKIGMTTKLPEERARELSSHTGVPSPFVVAYAAEVSDCAAAEAELHARLDARRMAANREFFEVPLKVAIQELDAIALRFPVGIPAADERGWIFLIGKRVLELRHLDTTCRRFEVVADSQRLGTCAYVPDDVEGGQLVGLPPDALSDDELDELESLVGLEYEQLTGRPLLEL